MNALHAVRRTSPDHTPEPAAVNPEPPAADAAGSTDCAHDGRDPREAGARMWDALVEAMHRLADTDLLPESHGATPRVTVTVDYDTLVAGLGEAGAARSGGTSTPPSAAAVRRLACDAEILPVVLGSRSQVLDVGRTHRLVTPGIWRALVGRDRHCAFPGCTRMPMACDAHHVRHWADGGPTALDNLVLLCRHPPPVIHTHPLAGRHRPRRRPARLPPATGEAPRTGGPGAPRATTPAGVSQCPAPMAIATLDAMRCSLTCCAEQLGGRRDAGGRLLDDHPDPGELQAAEPAGVERVGEQVHVVGVEHARVDAGLDRRGDRGQAGGDAAAEAVHRALADLVEQLRAGAAHQGQRAVDERRVLQAVVDEGGRDRAQPVLRRGVGVGRPPAGGRRAARGSRPGSARTAPPCRRSAGR